MYSSNLISVAVALIIGVGKVASGTLAEHTIKYYTFSASPLFSIRGGKLQFKVQNKLSPTNTEVQQNRALLIQDLTKRLLNQNRKHAERQKIQLGQEKPPGIAKEIIIQERVPKQPKNEPKLQDLQNKQLYENLLALEDKLYKLKQDKTSLDQVLSKPKELFQIDIKTVADEVNAQAIHKAQSIVVKSDNVINAINGATENAQNRAKLVDSNIKRVTTSDEVQKEVTSNIPKANRANRIEKEITPEKSSQIEQVNSYHPERFTPEPNKVLNTQNNIDLLQKDHIQVQPENIYSPHSRRVENILLQSDDKTISILKNNDCREAAVIGTPQRNAIGSDIPKTVDVITNGELTKCIPTTDDADATKVALANINRNQHRKQVVTISTLGNPSGTDVVLQLQLQVKVLESRLDKFEKFLHKLLIQK